MTEPNVKRLGIVASIVTITGAIIYLVKKPAAGLPVVAIMPGGGLTSPNSPALFQQPLPGGGVPITGPSGAAGPAGTPGTPGAVGTPGAPGTPYLGAAPGATPGYDGAAGYPGFGFTPNWFTPGAYDPWYLTSNLPPTLDADKFASIPSAAPEAGCGCGGSNGKCKTCSNAANSSYYPDGAGMCLSSTTATQVSAMKKCAPNLQANNNDLLRYMSIPTNAAPLPLSEAPPMLTLFVPGGF